MSGKTTVVINDKPHQFETGLLCPDDFRKAIGAEADYEVWQVVRNPDPEGELPKDDVQITECIEVASGTRIKVVPPGTFGVTTSALVVESELKELASKGLSPEVHPDGEGKAVVIKDYLLPNGYSQPTTDLLIRLPKEYPHANPDMFWVEESVKLAGGSIPLNADLVESHVGRQWRRFSWHINNRWHPGRDTLSTYLGFVDARLARKQ